MWSREQKETLRYLEWKRYSDVNEVFYGGAAGGGKTFIGCHWQIARRLRYPGTRGLIGRSELTNLKLTTLKTFFEVWEKYYRPYTDITMTANYQTKELIFSNGSVIFLKDLAYKPRDPEFAGLGSLEITDAFIDEVTELRERAFTTLKSRIRYKLINGSPKILAAGNPAHNWSKARWISDDNGVPVRLEPYQRVVRATVESNPDKEFVEQYKSNLEQLPELDRMRLLHGDWEADQNEAPWFYEFDGNRNTGSVNIDMTEPLWLSFDFNIDPTTCLVGQKITGKGVVVADELAVKGGTEALCERIKDMEYHLHPAGIWVTGDHSGNARSSSAGQLNYGVYQTDFEIIKRELSVHDRQMIDTRTPNRRLKLSRGIVNSALKHANVMIDRTACPILIKDLRTGMAKEDGKLLKNREVHKQDSGDAFRYMIHAMFASGEPVKEILKFKELL